MKKALSITVIIIFFAAHLSQAQLTAIPVKEIRPGVFSGEPRFVTVYNNAMYFAADNGPNGIELWKSDGTDAGTVMVKDIRPGGADSDPQAFAVSNGLLFFGANNGVNGWELWRSDGTEAGTFMVKDIYPGSTGSEADLLTDINGTLFFAARTTLPAPIFSTGVELWKSDGTEAGTVLVREIIVGSTSSRIGNLINFNGTLFFSGADSEVGNALWKSDGTAPGTVMVKEVPTGLNGGLNPNHMAVLGNDLFFSGFDVTNGQAWWRSDGTEAGTLMFLDIFGSSAPQETTTINGVLYFAASAGVAGMELWRSDGTVPGTVLLKDIYTGANSSTPTGFSNINGTCYFSANTALYGVELWKTDGTETGTNLVLDLEPGVSSSLPTNITGLNGEIYFVAGTDASGIELMKLINAALPITWLSFTGNLQTNNTVKLQWLVTDEVNNDHYVIEHADNGNNFRSLGTIPSKPVSSGNSAYEFIHQNPSKRNFYRIKQVDMDGRFEYSKTVSIEIKSTDNRVAIFPNPTTGSGITVKSSLLLQQKHSLAISAADGKLLKTLQIPRQSSDQFRLPALNLPPGIYFLKLQSPTNSTVERIIVK